MRRTNGGIKTQGLLVKSVIREALAVALGEPNKLKQERCDMSKPDEKKKPVDKEVEEKKEETPEVKEKHKGKEGRETVFDESFEKDKDKKK